MYSEPIQHFARLDPAQMDGFSARAIEQGQRYAAQGAVSRVAYHPSGALLGDVTVTTRACAAVWIARDDKRLLIFMGCTCSGTGRCRHIAALLYWLRATVKAQAPILAMEPKDKRYTQLQGLSRHVKRHVWTDAPTPTPQPPPPPQQPAAAPPKAPSQAPAAAQPKAPPQAPAAPPKAPPQAPAPQTSTQTPRLQQLSALPAARLAVALDALCAQDPALERRIYDLLGLRLTADDATLQRLTRAASDALLRAAALTKAASPDALLKAFSLALQALLDAGGVTQTLALWSDALPLLSKALDDDTSGDLYDALAPHLTACVGAVAAALPATGWPLLTQMRWLLTAEMSDPHNLMTPLSDPFWTQDIPPDTWRAFAADLAHLPPTPPLVEARVDALQNAGLPAEARALRRAHLDSPRALYHLLQLLSDQGDLAAAEAEADAALRRIIDRQATTPTRPETLRERLLGVINALTSASAPPPGSPAAAARVAWRWHAFTLRPTATSARLLLADADAAGCKAPIHAAVTAFLSAGEWPNPKTAWPQHVVLRPWLAPSALKGLPPHAFPLTAALLDLALEGDDPKAIYQWLQRARREGPLSYTAITRAADRLTATHPTDATSLWLEAALAAISRGMSDADLLTPIQRLRPLLGPTAWTAHVRSLLRQHQHRPRVVLLLNQALMNPT